MQKQSNDIIYKYQPLWGSWNIEGLIGKGSFGQVYKVSREVYGRKYISAVKIISIPTSEQIRQVQALTGINNDEMLSEYFEDMVKKIVNETNVLYSLKGHSNIISYEDHMVIKREAEIGWDIIIRMEYAASLKDFLAKNTLTRRDIITMGIEICKALELCSSYGIIHRDIKEENIFISDKGTFKLGDFSVAREVSATGQALTKVGTVLYMAPEVYNSLPYNITADIYSLGLVLYKLFNCGRLPFMPLYPEKFKPEDIEKSQILRMSGRSLPMPQSADEKLSSVILKAVAFNSDDRYQSPEEFRAALVELLKVYPDKILDETVNTGTGNVDEKNNAHETLMRNDLSRFGRNSFFHEKNVDEQKDINIDEEKLLTRENEIVDLSHSIDAGAGTRVFSKAKRIKFYSPPGLSNVDDIKDSKGFVESKKVHAKTYIFLIIMFLTFAFYLFLQLAEVEDYKKLKGSIKVNAKNGIVKNEVKGKVGSINFQEGKSVQEGDVLYTIENSTLSYNMETAKKEIEKLQLEIDNQNKFIESINQGRNLFDLSNENERAYYVKYQNYELEYNESIKKVVGSDMTPSDVKDKIEKMKKDGTDLLILQKSVNNDKNEFVDKNNQYSKMYEQYASNPSKNKTEMLKTVENLINTNNNEINKYQKAIDGYKTKSIVAINDEIKKLETSKQEKENALKQIELGMQGSVVQAPLKGTVKVIKEISKGDLLEEGEEILNIIPETEVQYRLDFYVYEEDFEGISKGQQIKCFIHGYPYSEYGCIHGKITKIDTDVKYDSISKKNYYNVEASLDKYVLLGKNNESIDILPGMTCDVQVITGRKKLFKLF